MTAFKTILVPLDEPSSAPAPLEAAFLLAARFNAHVTALHVRPDPTLMVPLVGEGMSGAMVEEMLGMAERQAGERAGEVRAIYDSVRLGHPLPEATRPPTDSASCVWREMTGREDDIVTRQARLHDLIVMARPIDHDSAASNSLNTVLLDSGKPILLVPSDKRTEIARHVAIAWNGSAEAARAVAYALPLLAVATKVTILTAAEKGAEASAGQELADSLAWHGLATNVHTVDAAHHAGPALLDGAHAVGADMLIMGAYTHSRLRQLILGGVTRHVIGHATLPVLLCH
ncbi:universal stress protein [Magnetospirillum moscoviense]|uniref:UspA domain-containing protein n=1 Tax=Magnetospirillum moscoviense TaxID=1437059 RepID=A0A178MJR2_9PROT|nr:universal stress protein [Magnetospirillum moscoviense]MBF0324613.1 universal stress protein [Alphaproteobacteria bacterium]OAN48916.1 hypothetical protein A6A05_02725 [Magnetospirillum moscoviense]